VTFHRFVLPQSTTLQKINRWLIRTAYVAAVGIFAIVVAQFYLPGMGFTFLLTLGDAGQEHYLPEIRASNVYVAKDLPGYDAQYYVQIAMRPGLDDPDLKEAVDNLPYRARRILLSWSSWAMGLGDPVRAMHAFTIQNMIAWLGLAVLLLRWFPPNCWGNFGRWFAVMFSFGMAFSLRCSLMDGPGLLLIACGVALIESGRSWLGAAVLGIAGLGKETNLLAGSALLRRWPESWRDRVVLGGKAVLVALPLALWLVVLQSWLGSIGDSGLRNFSMAFVGYARRWGEIFDRSATSGWDQYSGGMLAIHVGLTIQWLFLVLRPRWSETWWRIGASFAVLFLFLGDAVWEGYPGAAARVLLPITLAFNLLVPRGRRWLAVLVVGNIGVFFSPEVLQPPLKENFQVIGAVELRQLPATGGVVAPVFGEGWFLPERSRWEFWRWSEQRSNLTISNPHEFPIRADLRFDLRSNDLREVTVAGGGLRLWQGETSKQQQVVVLRNVLVPPGGIVLEIASDRPGVAPSERDPRPLAFSMRNLVIEITGRAGADGPPD